MAERKRRWTQGALGELDKRRVKAFAEVRALGKSQVEAAKAVGLTAPTPQAFAMTASRFEKRHQAEIVDMMDNLRRAVISKVSEDDILDASLQQKVTSVAILTDKIELLEGRATSRVLSVNYALKENQLAEIVGARDRAEVIEGRSRDTLGPEETSGVLDRDGKKLQGQLASPADS